MVVFKIEHHCVEHIPGEINLSMQTKAEKHVPSYNCKLPQSLYAQKKTLYTTVCYVGK